MYVLTRDRMTHEEHDVESWSVAVTGVLALRYAKVTCCCGATSWAANQSEDVSRSYRDLLDVAIVRIECPLSTSGIVAQSLR